MPRVLVERCPTVRIHAFVRAAPCFGWASWGADGGAYWTVDRDVGRFVFAGQPIEIVSTVPHFGGCRWWALCPGCRARVAVLYLGASGLYCRACYGLAYASTHESRSARALRKCAKLRARLGADPGPACAPPERPRGMWWSRFARLAFEVDAADMAALGMLRPGLERLERRVAGGRTERA